MDRKKQGDLGVAAAIFHYTKMGNVVCTPLVDSARYDLVVEIDGVLKKVQVKSGNFTVASGSYQIQLATNGGNQSWDKTKKFISESECDLVFIYCLDGKCYEFPVTMCEGKSSITLGTKYDTYKV